MYKIFQIFFSAFVVFISIQSYYEPYQWSMHVRSFSFKHKNILKLGTSAQLLNPFIHVSLNASLSSHCLSLFFTIRNKKYFLLVKILLWISLGVLMKVQLKLSTLSANFVVGRTNNKTCSCRTLEYILHCTLLYSSD